MRKILLFVLVLAAAAMNANAQILTTYPPGIDKKSFDGYYGSLAEFNMQEGLKLNSPHGYLVMLIGAKGIYLREVVNYMVRELKCDNHVASDYEDYPAIYEVKPGGILEWDDDKSLVRIESKQDDSLVIKSVKITGNTDLITKLFLYYWINSELRFDENKFKKGCLFYQKCGSDLISYNWKGPKPYLTISRNPTFPIPLPKIAQRQR